MKNITYEEFLLRQEKAKKSKSKYKNKKVWIDGYVFDSILEGKRYNQLKLLEKNGAIQSLELQPTFLLSDTLRVLKNGKKETYRKSVYKADFAYYKDGLFIVEDTKGMETETYKLKRKEFLLKDYCDVFMEIKQNKTNEYKQRRNEMSNDTKCIHDLEYLGVTKSNCSMKYKCKLCGKIIFKRLG